MVLLTLFWDGKLTLKKTPKKGGRGEGGRKEKKKGGVMNNKRTGLQATRLLFFLATMLGRTCYACTGA